MHFFVGQGLKKGIRPHIVKGGGSAPFFSKNREPGSEVTFICISWRGLNQHYTVRSFTVHSEIRGEILNFILEEGGV